MHELAVVFVDGLFLLAAGEYVLHRYIHLGLGSLTVSVTDDLPLLFELAGLHRDAALGSLDKRLRGLLQCRAKHLLLHPIRHLIEDLLGLLVSFNLDFQHGRRGLLGGLSRPS